MEDDGVNIEDLDEALDMCDGIFTCECLRCGFLFTFNSGEGIITLFSTGLNCTIGIFSAVKSVSGALISVGLAPGPDINPGVNSTRLDGDLAVDDLNIDFGCIGERVCSAFCTCEPGCCAGNFH